MTDRAEQEFFTPGNSADKDTCIVPNMASPLEDIVTQPAMKHPRAAPTRVRQETCADANRGQPTAPQG
jgi:hypothetical protein